MTKASNKSIRVDFTDGSYAFIRAPFKAVTKVECSCDAFEADASDSQHSADAFDNQHGSETTEPPPPSNPIPTPIKPEPPPGPPPGALKPELPHKPGAANSKLKIKAPTGTLPPPATATGR